MSSPETGAGTESSQARPEAGNPAELGCLELESFLPYKLSILSNRVSRRIARLYKQTTGLSTDQWRALVVIRRFGPMSAGQVSERTVMDKVRVSRSINHLVQAGLVHRTWRENDQRVSVLTATPEGRRLVADVTPRATAIAQQLEAAMTPTEAAQLHALLDRLLERSAEPIPDDG